MKLRRAAAATLSATVILQALPAPVAVADDVADEADLHFRLGTEAYAARDFRGALEHFLMSNRLVANRNVVFNIARTYEQLTQYADAHRYYSIALDVEQDAARRALITEAITRIRPYVAVLRVVTEPPGATIFINRRDLGPRGQTPRSLAFPPGRYRVLAELDGYEAAESPEVQGTLGQETLITLRLVRIVGTLRVEGDDGATVHVDRSDAPRRSAACPATSCSPPGATASSSRARATPPASRRSRSAPARRSPPARASRPSPAPSSSTPTSATPSSRSTATPRASPPSW